MNNPNSYQIIGLGLPLITEDEESLLKHPHIIENMLEILSSQLKADETFAVLGNEGSAATFVKAIKSSPLSSKLSTYYCSDHKTFNSENRLIFSQLNHRSFYELKQEPNYQYLIVWTKREFYLQLVRFLTYEVCLSAHIILPFIHQHICPQSQFENSTPIALILFPCAGTGRFYPVISYILDYSLRTKNHPESLTSNSRLMHKLQHSGQLNQMTVNKIYANLLHSLNYFEYISIHDPISTNILKNYSDLAVIYLQRDPRDILTSYYFRVYSSKYETIQENPTLKEQHFLELIEGHNMILPNYFILWPSLKTMAREFIAAQNLSHVFVVKFEDLHLQPIKTYNKLLTWLQFINTAYMNIQSHVILKALEKGSFEQQTGGVRARGSNHDQPFIDNGVTTSCRKGIIGDWKNHFSPKVIEKVKHEIGQELIELGYEDDLNW